MWLGNSQAVFIWCQPISNTCNHSEVSEHTTVPGQDFCMGNALQRREGQAEECEQQDELHRCHSVPL